MINSFTSKKVKQEVSHTMELTPIVSVLWLNVLKRSRLFNRLFTNSCCFRYLYDAKWQNPFHSAKKITRVLEGKHKPIFHPLTDCGDHVVVINSRHIALLGREWQFRVYFHHPGNLKILWKHFMVRYFSLILWWPETQL